MVVYDRLVNPSLLDHAPARAPRVYAGKRTGGHGWPQERITALLVAEARAGRRVVRLKGGDPFVFGRGGEEAEALAAAGIPFEVVPGVTAAVAVPAYAGIPLTHREVSSSFAVVTGHEVCGRPGAPRGLGPARHRGGHARRPDGPVRPPGDRGATPGPREAAETPVALIRWGTTSAQETLTGTLGDIVARARAASLEPPVVVVIGEVVALRDGLRWFDAGPAAAELALEPASV